MSNTRLLAVTVTLCATLILVVGCSGERGERSENEGWAPREALPEGEPYAEGVLLEVESAGDSSGPPSARRMLVAHRDGDARDGCGIINASLDTETQVFAQDEMRETLEANREPGRQAITPGLEVRVWTEGDVTGSCPPQGYAAFVEIVGFGEGGPQSP